MTRAPLPIFLLVLLASPAAAAAADGARELTLWAGGALLVLTLLLVLRKHKGLARAHATAPDLLWEGSGWEPPRLRVSTFRKAGKVADLSDVEALVLLGLPFRALLAMVLDGLAAAGRVRRERKDDEVLLARTAESPPDEDPYQACGWEVLGYELQPLPRKMASALGELVVGTLQRKAWDAVLDATRAHYRRLFGELFPDEEAVTAGSFREEEEQDFFYPWWVSHQHASGPAVWSQERLDRGEGGRGGDVFHVELDCWGPVEAERSLHDFAEDELVPPYEHTACHSACHSAGHAACHSACHSACHAACHSACHSACHTACVEGF